MIGSRLGHMGLTGEQGAQTEGKTTTQHHCWVSVACVVLKHCSPKDKKDRSKHKETPPKDARQHADIASEDMQTLTKITKSLLT